MFGEWVRASAWLLGVRTSGRSALPRTSPGLIQKYTIKSYKFRLLFLINFTFKTELTKHENVGEEVLCILLKFSPQSIYILNWHTMLALK